MTAKNIFQAATALFALIMLSLAFIFWRDLDSALVTSGHRLDSLGKVLAGRNIGMAVLALFAMFYRDLKVMSVALSIFAFLGLIDGYIYYSQGYPFIEHTIVGTIMLVALVGLQYYRMKNPEGNS